MEADGVKGEKSDKCVLPRQLGRRMKVCCLLRLPYQYKTRSNEGRKGRFCVWTVCCGVWKKTKKEKRKKGVGVKSHLPPKYLSITSCRRPIYQTMSLRTQRSSSVASKFSHSTDSRYTTEA